MKVIYEPSGRAKEYAELALNNYYGCTNACAYCYAPNVMRADRAEYHAEVKPRTEQVLKWFQHDCRLMKANNDRRRVHMSFISDPYPDIERELHLTRYCLNVAKEEGVGVNILTKGKYDVVSQDFDLMKEAGVHFGVTCCFWFDKDAKAWEPNAESVTNRLRLLDEAHRRGIYTWVSMEPVIYPAQALMFFKYCSDIGIVDLWKVGKLNYHPHAKTVDWVKFREDFRTLADSYKANYIIKRDLAEAV